MLFKRRYGQSDDGLSRHPGYPSKKQILLVMKLTAAFLLLICVHVSASSFSQRVTLDLKNASVEELLQAIREQTGYTFVYNIRTIRDARPVDISVKNARIEDVLSTTFRMQPFTYEIRNRTVVVKRRREIPEAIREMAVAPEMLSVSGTITDSAGQALTGVTVRIKGKNKQTTTDDAGRFSLPDAEPRDVLIISYVGYKTMEVPINGRTSLRIIMQVQPESMDDVKIIATGYQRIAKHQLTGAASSMTQKDYDQRVAVTGNFLESLEGKIPGLVYNSQSDELSIRGVSTFDAVKKPLIVVDGFPTEIDIRTINPIDIVSVTVLRDAAAASIYGVRASNGVIVIETKRGKSGKPVFSARATYAQQSAPDFGYLNYAPSDEFVQLQVDQFNKANPNELLYTLLDWAKDPVYEILFDLKDNRITQEEADMRLSALKGYDNASEYKKLFYKNRQTVNLNADASGGNDRATYLLGMNFIGDRPVERRSENNQFIVNLANTYKFSDRIKFDMRTTYTNVHSQKGNIPGYADFFPYEQLADENGNALPVRLAPGKDYSTYGIPDYFNDELIELGMYDQRYFPYKELFANTTKTKMSALRFQGRFNTRITNWLNVDIGGAYETQNALTDYLQTEDAYWVRRLINSRATKDPNGRPLFNDLPQGDILTKTTIRTAAYTLRGQLNFNHTTSNRRHDFAGILGIEQRKTLEEGFKTAFFGYDDQSLIGKPINMQKINGFLTSAYVQTGSIAPRFNMNDYFGQTHSDRRFMSYYGQATYTYNEKYIATGSFRIDQSNLFGVDPKYRYKPLWSTGLSWRMNREDFLAGVHWLDELKLRLATGFNGNVPSSNNGPFLILRSALNNVFNTPLIYNDVLSPENQSLRWETTRNYNAGIDYSFFNSRISGSIDWYLKKSIDVFGDYDADPTSGFNQYRANTASIENKGLEFLVSSLNLKRKQFEWRTQVTAAFNHNKVVAVKASEFDNSEMIVSAGLNMKGYPMGALFSYNYGGLDELGRPFVYDSKGNKNILNFYGNAVTDVTIDDLIYNGTTTPKYTLGLNNQITLGDFDLSFLFMYYGGHVMRVAQPNPLNVTSTVAPPLKGSANFWREPGDEANTRIPGFTPGSSLAVGYYASYARYGYQYASEFVRKADYIRLRDVILTYNPRFRFLSQMGLSRPQIRLQAQNPFKHTFSGNDIDPEAIDRLSGVRRLPVQPFYSVSLFTNF